MTDFELFPVYTETLSADDYLDVYNHNSEKIERVRVLVNPFGSEDFIRFEVTYNEPTFMVRAASG